jgi:putative ABC transport system permease protein
MLKNYLKTAWRNLRRNSFYTSLNIIGLSVGLATCMLIILYVFDELSYDGYNVKADRIYRVNNEVKFGGNHFDLAITPAQMGITMVQEIPEVEHYTRFQDYGNFLVKKDNRNIRENHVGWTDSTVFDVFTLPMIAGDPRTALVASHSIVITEKIAKKYFGQIDVVGKNLIINDTINYKVTGVIKDIPTQSHFTFDFLLPLSENPGSRDDNWLSENWNTYILLKPGTDTRKVVPKLDEMLLRHTEVILQNVLHQGIKEFNANGGKLGVSLTPLKDIHLRSNKVGELQGNGNIQYVYIFSAVTILILLIACVNFMNLSTARSSNRAKEVGVRKVLGSLKSNLVTQFLTESMLISFIALIISFLLAWLLLPYFNQIAGKEIHLISLFQPLMLIAALVLMVVVGLLAGSYPAFFLSAFQPIDVLKGKLAKGFKGSWLRNALVVFQFFISIVLIISTIIIYKQLTYIRNKDIGFTRNQVLMIRNTDVLGTNATAFKDGLLKISGISNATMTGYLPVNGFRNNDAFFTSPALEQKTAMSMQQWRVDENYLPTFDIKLLEGRNFSKDFPSDSSAIIINEAAAKFLNTKDLINKKLYEIDGAQTGKTEESHIIGVFKNFNFSSLRDVVTPLALKLRLQMSSIAIRTNSANINSVIEQIRSNWQKTVPGQPFDFAFMDEEFNSLYRTEQQTGRLFVSFAVLAILIASLGLFGLVTFAAEQRTKEIGIRKVLGASIGYLTRMLSKDFMKLVLIAAVIAFPLAWWMMNKWLQDFAYRTNINWWIFLLAGAIAAFIALFTVSFQAIKAAMQNPVKSLRSE